MSMNRRKMIKSLALSTGIFVIPGLHNYFRGGKPLYLINIGSFWYQCLEEFCTKDSDIKCVSIGWDEDLPTHHNIKNITIFDFDFSAIDTDYYSEANKSYIVPQRILDIFNPDNKYLLVTDLLKQNTILAKGIIHWLQSQQIDFHFMGTTPLVHNSLANWAKTLLSEFENDPRAHILDVNNYLSNLDKLHPGIMANIAFGKLDDEVYRSLTRLKIFLLN